MSDHQRMPHYSNTFSAGNILQVLVTVVAVTGAFYTVNNRSANNEDEINRVERQQRQLSEETRSDFRSIENRVRVLENQTVRSDERLTSVLTLLSRIDSRLERIENNQPPLQE